MKADHNSITLFGIKVMSKYKLLSKRERGVIKMAVKVIKRVIKHIPFYLVLILYRIDVKIQALLKCLWYEILWHISQNGHI